MGAVAAVGGGDRAEVFEGLHELVAKELVRPERDSSIEGEAEFSFVHALVCDVAYAQLTKADRAVKHAALARWLEERTAGRTEDLAEVLAFHYGTALEMATSCGLDLEDELLEPTSATWPWRGAGRTARRYGRCCALRTCRARERGGGSSRRWLLTRRTRRTLRRRAPLLVAAAAVISVAAVAGLAIWAFGPAKVPSKTMTPAQIAAEYTASVVRITTPVMPATATGTGSPGRIVGSGFMLSESGVIATSTAVVQGRGLRPPSWVTVEYALPSGEYGKTIGRLWDHNESFGVALVVVDSEKVPLQPLPSATRILS